MEILSIEHTDFVLKVECNDSTFVGTSDKAFRNVGVDAVKSTYSWTDGVNSVVVFDGHNKHQILNNSTDRALFFENTDYPIWVEFNENSKVRNAYFNTALRTTAENFHFHEKRQILSGFVNYGNEIGHSDISLSYELMDGRRCSFSIRYDVLSTKLDYHAHWKTIVSDIEAEYRMLSIDFLKKTYHSFQPDSHDNEKTHDIIWWQIFKTCRDNFEAACTAILNRPRHRLKDEQVMLRADKIRHFSPSLANEYAEHRYEENYRYGVSVPLLNNDTYENRFFKYAVAQVAASYSRLSSRILQTSDLSDSLRNDILSTVKRLDLISKNPFFRNIGRFKGLKQGSLVLQNDSFYSCIYRTWVLLMQSYSLNEGLYNLETKDIATLYEIWCFIEMKRIVKEQLGEDTEVVNVNRNELSGSFVLNLNKGSRSNILFRKGDVELAELFYNPKQSENDNSDLAIPNLVERTVPQKPDIVLQLTRHTTDGKKLTYLFDAKYRIKGREGSVDTPPDDAINQMHRYRDAIYYQEYDKSELKKEVIGGYILFPGAGDKDDVSVAKFYKSINEVNIGAFPLRPADDKNISLLKSFIAQIIGKNERDEVLSEVIPQKGLRYIKDSSETVLFARTKNFTWVCSQQLYNIPLEKVSSMPELLTAGILLLRNPSTLEYQLFKIKKNSYRVMTSAELIASGYINPTHKAYFIFGVEPIEMLHRIIDIPNYIKGLPYAVIDYNALSFGNS